MKRPKLLLALLLSIPILSWAVAAHAQSFQTGTNVTVPTTKTVNSTLYVSGSNIDIAGTVNGDVFCAGQSVTVTGTVNGDVICAGQSVTVTGTVSGNVRLAGQSVTLGGSVEGNASIAAQTFVEQSGGKIAGDLGVVGQSTTINGTVGRDLAVGSGTLVIDGTVGRNVRAEVERLTLDSSAQVAGDIAYTSPNKLTTSSGAQVSGTVKQTVPPETNKSATSHALLVFSWAFAIYMFIALLIVALGLVLLAPRAFQSATDVALKAGLGKTFLVGLVASIVVPVVLIMLLFTVFGIPLVLLLGLMWLLVELLAGVFAAYLLGRVLLRKDQNSLKIMLVGAAILFFLYFVPFIGWLIALVGFWFGVGTILLQLKASHDASRLAPVTVPVKETKVVEAKTLKTEE